MDYANTGRSASGNTHVQGFSLSLVFARELIGAYNMFAKGGVI